MTSFQIEKAWRICLATTFASAMGVTTINACATSRMAEAQIRLIQDVPCFGVSGEDEKGNGMPLIAAVIVSDAQGEFTKRWSFRVGPEAQPLPLRTGACFLYGQVPSGAVSSQIAAPVLLSEHMYDVYLHGRTADPGDPTMGYQARFCLVKRPDGGRRLVQFAPGSPEWRQGTCSLPAR